MFRKFKKLIICLLLIICIGMIAIPVLAEPILAEPNFGFEYATATKLGTRDLKAVITQVVNILLGFLGIVAIVIILYGGYLYMTSGGAADKVERAKKILINGAIGLGIILSSYAIAFFIISALTRSTGGNEGECGNEECGAGETCSNCPQDCDCPPPPPGGKNFAVSWVDPKRAETDVSLCRLVQIKFNNKIDPDTIDNNSDTWAGSFIIDATIAKTDVNLLVEIDGGFLAGIACEKNNQCASGTCDTACQGNLVPGNITMWSDARGLTFNNTNDFERDTTYKITIKSSAFATSGLENINGNRLTSGDYTWTFTTGKTTDVIPPKVLEVFPSNDAIDVCRASAVEAEFSEPMDVSSLLSTDVGSPMDGNSNNSIYINPNISGFNKSVFSSDTLIANPKESYTANTNYTPVLDSDVIRDSCGNYLDGDADGASEFSAGGDDYAPSPVGTAPDWSFTTGNIEKCVPEIISIIPSAGYYNDESAQNVDLLTINGNYFTMVGSLIFNNNVEVSSAINSCIDPTLDANYIPNQKCLTSWSDHKIEVRVPAQGGVSNGAISGNVAVEVGVNSSNVIQFTVASPHIDSILPKEGGIEQFVTISGTGFGAAKGENDHVYFRRDEDGDTNIEVAVPAELVEANYPCAGNVGWTNEQIIISIPDNVSFTDGEDWYIQVVRDQTTNKYWGNLGDFKFKNVVPGPGLCSITNIEIESDYHNSAKGVLDDTFQLSGVRFAGAERKVYFGNYENPVLAKQISNWVDDSLPNTVSADVPNIAEGRAVVYLKIDGQNSNTLNFIIHPTDTGPQINYFEPTSGAAGEYITIYGNGFGSWDGGIANNEKANVQFTNGAGELVNGNFVFSTSCGDNFWSDTQIIVKIPVINTQAGLIGYWPLNELSAKEKSPINDISNQNNDGILFTGSDDYDKSTDGKIDGALTFDGVNDRIHIDSVNNFKYSGNDMSISVWIYPDSNEKTGGVIISQPWNSTRENNYSIFFNKDSKIEFNLKGSEKTGYFVLITQQTYAKNQWHHITITINAISKLASIYVDGKLDNSAIHNINSWMPKYGDDNTPLCIGTFFPYDEYWTGDFEGGSGSHLSFQGKIDEVAIYNRVLSEKEVENYYNLLGEVKSYIKVITKDAFSDDTSDLSPSNFTITQGPAGPSICNIQPKGGPIGTSVEIFGERFTDADKIIFFNNKEGLNFTLTDDEKASDVVPSEAVSGPIIIVDDKNGDSDYNDAGEKSNGYNFAVSDCREAKGGCSAIGYPNYECCYDGSCMNPCNNPTQATYAWDFSTGAYTTCGGYGANQCLASISCPNSPGQCSSSQATTFDTNYNCGDNYCNTSFPAVCDDECVFSNNSCARAAACDIEKKVSEIIVDSNIGGVARCNTVSKEKYYWQTDVPCQSGTYLDINGKCTLGSASAPKSCNPNCANNFNCVNLGGTGGACVKQNICPSGSICDINTFGSDNYNACKKDLPSKCECCCRVDHSDTDCCTGLTCEDDTCGTDDATKYGHCKGCAVWENITNNTPPWTFFPTLSDDKCGCQNSNRICIVDEKLVSPARDTGSCGDCANINDIDFGSDGDKTFDKIKDIKHECQTHSGSCCWNSLVNSCYTCDALEVMEESCPPKDVSSPSPQKNKTDACLNSAIYLKFNLELNPKTLIGGFRIYKCAAGDRNCASNVAGTLNLIGFHNELIFTPDANLTPDTWHKVVINQNLKDLNDLNLSSNYEWYFKTKDGPDLCSMDGITITPKDEIITIAFDTRVYSAVPMIDCIPLNPFVYNWVWQSSDTNIATITNADIMPNLGLTDPQQTAAAQDKDGSTKIMVNVPTDSKQAETNLFVLLEDPKVVDYWPNCKEACLNASVGAKFNMAMDTTTLTAPNIKLYKWLCGNGEIDIGEDCDDGGVKPGDGCSANCLNEGSNSKTSICGNGTIELGEECDGNPLPQGCDMNKCIHTGSVANLSICGDRKIAEGEDCDDGNAISRDGCSGVATTSVDICNENTAQTQCENKDIDCFWDGASCQNFTVATSKIECQDANGFWNGATCDGNRGCLNEGTDELINIFLGTISPNEVNNTIDINLPVETYFQPNINYRVFLFNNIRGSLGKKQLTDLNWDFNKDNTNDSFSWSFKTKSDFCSPDKVQVAPEQKVIYNINATQDYTASIYGSPDSCNPKGQKLNPYFYNWSWTSENENVATITQNNFWPSCGNKKIETGEDCDDGGVKNGDGCSANCLNEGSNSKTSICGNGTIELGEECDGNPFPQGCDLNTCLHTGSLGVCGNGAIETGEDCDDHNTTNGDGCSSVCLNEGTQGDNYKDFYQIATTKSPGTTNITASVNYCSGDPLTTCGGTLTTTCPTGSNCKQTTGKSELEVVCGFSNDDDCNLPATTKTCNFENSGHICPITTWGGECSTSKKLCYSQNDCSDSETCQAYTDCNYCKNNTSFECRAANNFISGTGNYDCQLGVGSDSCCYSRPIIKSKSPDPSFFNSNSINCVDNFCSAFSAAGTAVCQTYTCQNINTNQGTCSAYGKCKKENTFGGYCLSNNDCPSDSTCDKSCANNSDCNDIVCGACRNAQINITFDKLMDPSSFTNNGVCSNNSSKSCDQDSNCPDGICLKNIRLGVKYDDAAINQKNCPSGYYAENNLVYQPPKTFIAKLAAKIKIWFNKLFGQKETIAAEYWCAIPGTITSFDSNNRTTAVFAPQGLKDNLFEDGVTYRVTVKHNVKRIEGVSMGKDDASDFQYEFTAGDTECQVESVDVYVGN